MQLGLLLQHIRQVYFLPRIIFHLTALWRKVEKTSREGKWGIHSALESGETEGKAYKVQEEKDPQSKPQKTLTSFSRMPLRASIGYITPA